MPGAGAAGNAAMLPRLAPARASSAATWSVRSHSHRPGPGSRRDIPTRATVSMLDQHKPRFEHPGRSLEASPSDDADSVDSPGQLRTHRSGGSEEADNLRVLFWDLIPVFMVPAVASKLLEGLHVGANNE